jgi:predicted GNAT superfamily acetyltransferase
MPDNFTVRDLSTAADYDAFHRLQVATWGAGYAELVPKSVVRLAQRLGGVAAGAFDENDQMMGLVFGIPGVLEQHLVHWSDLLAVRPEVQNQGLGETLKRYQRAELLARGVQVMYWSFDPLEARNAYFNFVRLGIRAHSYARDFYGESASPLHQGIGTDRLIALWELESAHVSARLNREVVRDDSWASATIVNPPVEDDTERCVTPRLVDAPVVRIAIPAQIQRIKKERPEIARQWRTHTRAAFEYYMAQRYVVLDFLRMEFGGTYVLTRDAALLS